MESRTGLGVGIIEQDVLERMRIPQEGYFYLGHKCENTSEPCSLLWGEDPILDGGLSLHGEN